jgi:hypothetical protein
MIWALYLAVTFDWMFGSMVFQILLLGVVGSVAGVAAYGFLTRYTRGS